MNINKSLFNIIEQYDTLKSYIDTLYITGGFVRDYVYSKYHNTEFEFNDYDFTTSKNILNDSNLSLTSIQKKYYYYAYVYRINVIGCKSFIYNLFLCFR